MRTNPYIPFPSKILDVIKHTEKEYTFRLEFKGDVKPGQFFEVSIPKFGEAPISVSGITENSIDLTILMRYLKIISVILCSFEGRTVTDLMLINILTGNVWL